MPVRISHPNALAGFHKSLVIVQQQGAKVALKNRARRQSQKETASKCVLAQRSRRATAHCAPT